MTSVFRAQLIKGINEKIISKVDARFVMAAINETGSIDSAADIIMRYGERIDGDIDVILPGYSIRDHKMIAKRIIDNVCELSITVDDLPGIE